MPLPEPVPAPRTVDVTITALDRDAVGVGKIGDQETGGQQIRVPFTLPGERVQARIWRQDSAATTVDADLEAVVVPAAGRRAPPCPLFGICGGCQLQHLPYPDQLAWKTRVVRELAAALPGPFDVAACVGSPRELGYRSKITPHNERARPGRPLAIGFLKAGRRHEVVDVERCLLATDGINAHLPLLRAEAAARAVGARRGATYLIREAASGITTDPDATVRERVGALELTFTAREFFQNNPFLLPRLVATAVEEAAAGGARLLVDTYSGSGLFALAAAARFREVVGVEVSGAAVAAARENAARNRLANVRFVATDAAHIFAEVAGDGDGTDAAVIVDPPRKGCDEAFLTQLIAFAPRTIVYVSCNPTTLVRDLQKLAAAGYQVARLQPFDMFPQTRHVECIATARR